MKRLYSPQSPAEEHYFRQIGLCLRLSFKINVTDTKPCCVCGELMRNVPTVLGSVADGEDGVEALDGCAGAGIVYENQEDVRKEDRDMFDSKSLSGFYQRS